MCVNHAISSHHDSAGHFRALVFAASAAMAVRRIAAGGSTQAQAGGQGALMAYVGTFSSLPLRDVLPTQVDLPQAMDAAHSPVSRWIAPRGFDTEGGVYELGTRRGAGALNILLTKPACDDGFEKIKQNHLFMQLPPP